MTDDRPAVTLLEQAAEAELADHSHYVRVYSWVHDGVGGHNSGRVALAEALYGPYSEAEATIVADAVLEALWPGGLPDGDQLYDYGSLYVDVLDDRDTGLVLPMDLAADEAAAAWEDQAMEGEDQ